jgi:hypothetical protein
VDAGLVFRALGGWVLKRLSRAPWAASGVSVVFGGGRKIFLGWKMVLVQRVLLQWVMILKYFLEKGV